MYARLLAGLIAGTYCTNGLWMLTAPLTWYDTIPGVVDTGPFNSHFIRDIGFAFVLSGIASVIAALRPHQFALWLAAGSAWPAMHALLHLAEWTTHGMPAAAVATAELLAIQLPVVTGMTLAIMEWRRQAAGHAHFAPAGGES